jgi:hypothetical protein
MKKDNQILSEAYTQINEDTILLEKFTETYGINNARNLLKFKNKAISADKFLRSLIIGDLHPDNLKSFVVSMLNAWKRQKAEPEETAMNIYHKLTSGY